MSRVVFHTATSLDGFIADDADSLDWLFGVPGAEGAEKEFEVFLDDVGAMVMGATTYEWLWNHQLAEHPESWARSYGERPTFVFTHRDLPVVPSAPSIRFVRGDVRDHAAEILRSARAGIVWIVGGGDLAGQFADAGLLDEVRLSIAPVTLGAGRPLLPRRLESDRLHLRSTRQAGQFAELTFDVAATDPDRPPTPAVRGGTSDG